MNNQDIYFKIVRAIIIAAIISAILAANLTVFEDGSFYFFHSPTLSGCIPNQLCN